jgi:NDP-sugar pyrophosphorylase family protein
MPEPRPEEPPRGAVRTAVLLAAGSGMRMAPFTEEYPKPLLPVLGRPVLEHQIEGLKAIGVERFVVVVGALGYQIARWLGDGSRFGVRIEYAEQKRPLGIAHALAQADRQVDEPFVLTLGDIMIPAEGFAPLAEGLRDPNTYGVLLVKEEPSKDAMRRNFSVETGPDGFVRRVVEKPRYPRTTVKGLGWFAFHPAFFDAVRNTPRTALRDEYEIVHSIQRFIDDGYGVKTVMTEQAEWNLTTPDDLLEANLRLLGEQSIVSAGARLHPGCVVTRSVVMDGAVVEHPVRVEGSLLLPGARWAANKDVRNRIVTPRHTVALPPRGDDDGR